MEYYGGNEIDMKQFRQMFITCLQLPVTLLLLTYVLWFMGSDGWEGEPVVLPRLLIVLFAVLAAASLPVALWVRQLSMRPPSPKAAKLFGLTPEAQQQVTPVGRITMAVVVGMALPEVSVLLGFVLGFQLQSWSIYLPFAAYAVLGWIVMFPRPAQVREWYARQVGGTLPQPNVVPAERT